jgi:hypothetical protein
VAAALSAVGGGAAGAGAYDPSFAPGMAIPGGLFAVADFNRDGKPDLAVTRSNGIAILLGLRGGGFTTARLVSVQTQASSMVADFNGDAIPDLGVESGSHDFTVLLGDGKGGFAAAPESPAEANVPLAIADLDGDGKADLVVNGGSGKLTILLGDGSGRFARAAGSPFAAGSVALSAVAVADFDRDGTRDLAVGGDFEYLLILPGRGEGRFGAAKKIPLPARETVSLAVADFNRDGKPDLGVASVYDGSVTILLGDGRGGFRRASHDPVLEHPLTDLAVADLDGNRVPDLAVAGDGETAVLLGNGGGGFHPAVDSPLAVGAEEVAAADVDGDRRVDLVVSEGHGVTILFQTRPAPAVRPARPLSGPLKAVLSTRQPVDVFAADGNRVATCGAGFRIVVWEAPGRKSTSLETADLPPTAKWVTDCPDSLALGDGQVAWISTRGGNTQQEHDMFVASLSGGKAKWVDRVERSGGLDRPAQPGTYLGHLSGGGALLAYDRWLCRHTNPASDDACDRLAKQQLVRIVGGRRVIARRGIDSYPLRAVGGGRMAVVSGGAVTVLSPSGSRIAKVAALEQQPTRAVALATRWLAVERTFALDLYDPASARRIKSLALGSAAALELGGINDKLALLKGRQRLVLVRLSDGKLIALTLHDAIKPQLTEAGLVYGYNTPKAAMNGHLVFEPTAKLLRRF